MLQPLKNQLNSMRVVLASGSPRRQELMRNIVSKFNKKIDFEREFIHKGRPLSDRAND